MKWLILIGGLAFVGILIYSSFEQNRFHYQVCVNFHGRQECATASGRTQEDAVRAAQEIDCSALANGRDENMVCLATVPSSVQFLSGK